MAGRDVERVAAGTIGRRRVSARCEPDVDALQRLSGRYVGNAAQQKCHGRKKGCSAEADVRIWHICYTSTS